VTSTIEYCCATAGMFISQFAQAFSSGSDSHRFNANFYVLVGLFPSEGRTPFFCQFFDLSSPETPLIVIIICKCKDQDVLIYDSEFLAGSFK